MGHIIRFYGGHNEHLVSALWYSDFRVGFGSAMAEMENCLTIASSGPAKLRAFLCESLSLHFRTKRRYALRSADAGRYVGKTKK